MILLNWSKMKRSRHIANSEMASKHISLSCVTTARFRQQLWVRGFAWTIFRDTRIQTRTGWTVSVHTMQKIAKALLNHYRGKTADEFWAAVAPVVDDDMITALISYSIDLRRPFTVGIGSRWSQVGFVRRTTRSLIGTIRLRLVQFVQAHVLGK